MVRVLSPDGPMEKLESSCLNPENYCMLSMMLIIMDVLQLMQLQMGKGLSLVVLKVKLEYGKLQNKLKLWRLL